jgi:hypothetical protein
MPDSSIRQFIYSSQSVELLDENKLKDLLAQARDNNAQHSITGVLLHIYNRFVQCIEGEHADVSQLIENIQQRSKEQIVHASE